MQHLHWEQKLFKWDQPFLTSEESITHDVYKKAVLRSTDTSTTVTRAFSGKYARGIRNEFIEKHEGKEEDLPMYPVQNVLTSKIRQQAAKQNNGEYMSLWAGQASSLARIESAQHVVERVMKEADNVIEQLQKYIEKDHLNNSSGLFFSLLYKIVGWLHQYKPSLSNLSACDLLRSIYHTHDLEKSAIG